MSSSPEHCKSENIQVKSASRGFAAIAVSYFMGLFNDNFYKEAALVIAVMQGNNAIQAAAAGVFTVSYMLAAAPGGWWADRFAKGHVIIIAKAVEFAAMIIGALGIWTGNWWLVLTMIGLMGAQSAVFSPAMNGSIPELYPPKHVQSANTIVRVLSTTAIFMGMALAGFLMDMRMPSCYGIERGVLLVGVFVIGASLIGLAVAAAAPRIAPHKLTARFPWHGPLESIRELFKISRDRLLTVCLLANIFIWSMAAVMTLLMVNLGLRQFGLSPSLTAGMKIIFLVGVALGGLLSNYIAKGRRFFNVLVPTYYTMAGLLILMAFAPLVVRGGTLAWLVVILIMLTGIAGGVNLVPLESFIQIRPAANEKGRVIAAANFAVFAGMTVSAVLLYVLNKLFEPTTSLGVLGVITMIYAGWLAKRLACAREDICDF